MTAAAVAVAVACCYCRWADTKACWTSWTRNDETKSYHYAVYRRHWCLTVNQCWFSAKKMFWHLFRSLRLTELHEHHSQLGPAIYGLHEDRTGWSLPKNLRVPMKRMKLSWACTMLFTNNPFVRASPSDTAESWQHHSQIRILHWAVKSNDDNHPGIRSNCNEKAPRSLRKPWE